MPSILDTKPSVQSSRPARARWLVAALTAASVNLAAAQPGPQVPWAVDPLVGLWASEITQRNCVNGAPLVVLKGTLVFHHGGTLSETTNSPPTSRGPGHGTWQRQGDGYVSRFRFLRYLPDGNFAGFVVISTQFAMSADGALLTGPATLSIQDPAGTVVATGCATQSTTRLP